MGKVRELELSIKVDCLKELVMGLEADRVMYMCNDLKSIVSVKTEMHYCHLHNIESYFPEFVEMVNEGGRELEGDEYREGTAWVGPWGHDLDENQFKIMYLQELITKLQGND